MNKRHDLAAVFLIFALSLVAFLAPLKLHANFNQYQVSCENVDSERCSPSVAALRHDTGVCTAFLVTKNIMATNLHCVPEDIRSENSVCTGRLKAYFPKTVNYTEENYECEKIISVSPPLNENGISIDYAFFEIKGESTRPNFEINQKGIADSAMMTIYKVDPEKDKGVLRKVTCEAIQKSVLNPYFMSDVSPLISLSPCPIIKGNSGSPLVAEDGSVRGIVSSITSVPTLIHFPNSGNKTVAFGSNFSCINTFFLGVNRGNPKDCELKIDEAIKKRIVDDMNKKVVDSLNGTLNKTIETVVDNLTNATKKTVRWKVVQMDPTEKESKFGISNVYSFEPECLLPNVQNVDAFASKLKDAPVSFEFPLVKILVLYDLDLHMRIRGEVRQESVKVDLSVNPRDFLKKIDIPVQMKRDSTKGVVKVPLCQFRL